MKFYLNATMKPEQIASVYTDMAAWEKANHSADFWIDPPRINTVPDPSGDTSLVNVRVHVDVRTKGKKDAKKSRNALIDVAKKWRAAGADFDEATHDDDNIFDEAPELRRLTKGETVAKPVRQQLADALSALEESTRRVAAADAVAAHERSAVEALKSELGAESAKLDALRNELRSTRDASAEELKSYTDFIEAFRSARPSLGELPEALRDAWAPFRSPDEPT